MGGAGAVVHRRRTDARDRLAHGRPIEQVDRFPCRRGQIDGRRGARAVPGHELDVVAREQFEHVAAGEARGAGDQDRARHRLRHHTVTSRRTRRIVWPGNATCSSCLRVRMSLPRHAAHRAAERREIPKAGERERQEEAAVGGEGGSGAEVEPLIFEREAAALGVVKAWIRCCSSADRRML